MSSSRRRKEKLLRLGFLFDEDGAVYWHEDTEKIIKFSSEGLYNFLKENNWDLNAVLGRGVECV